MGHQHLQKEIEDTVRNQIEELYESLEEGTGNWGEWETDFIDSVYDHVIANGRKASPRQENKIEELWEKL